MSSGVYNGGYVTEGVALCGIKIHPAALHARVRVLRFYGRDHLQLENKVDNDEPANVATISGNCFNTAGCSPAQAAAAAVLFAYIHEAGEHFIIDGYPLNQHYSSGLKNTINTLRDCVLPWLENILERGQYTSEPAPTEFNLQPVSL